MGGINSGNWAAVAKRTVESCWALDVNKLNRYGALRPGYYGSVEAHSVLNLDAEMWIHSHADWIEISHPSTLYRSWESRIRYSIRLSHTPGQFGGIRRWFLCPGEGCARRIVKLYSTSSFFRCRDCHELTYQSTRDTRLDRSIKRLKTLRHRLEWDADHSRGNGDKPYGMHRETFDRLVAEHQSGVRRVSALMDLRFRRRGAGCRPMQEMSLK